MNRWTCCLCTVGQVGPAVCGVTSLGDEVFVLRNKESDQLEVYDIVTYRLQRCVTLSNARGFADLISCEHYYCMYISISDPVVTCIHRVEVHGAATQWPVNDMPAGLSVNKLHNVLVTCTVVRKIKEFSSHGDLLREMTLPDDVSNPEHAIELTTDQFVVCHGIGCGNALHRVCLLSVDCTRVVYSHGWQCGSDAGQYNVPARLAVDDNEYVLVADMYNRRVTLLSPTLNYIRQVVSSDKLKWGPCRLHLDIQRRRLYVAENEWKEGKFTAGRVVVFSI